MITQLLRELLPFMTGQPRRIVALLALYAIAATYPDLPIAHEWTIENFDIVRFAGVAALLYWVVAEIIAQYSLSVYRAVPYHEFEQFRKDQMLANEEAADMLVRLHSLLSADDDTTLADKVGRLENLSLETDARQLRVLDVIDTPYYETDKKGRLTLVNEAFASLYNTTPRQMVRIGTSPFIHQHDIDKVVDRYRTAIVSESGYTVQFRIVVRGQLVGCVRVVGYPVRDAEGELTGHYGFAERIECESN